MTSKLKISTFFYCLFTVGISFGQKTLNTTITSSQVVEDPVSITLSDGFSVDSNKNITFIARIKANPSNPINSEPCSQQYGKIVISEVFFDTRFQETINTQEHHYGEYIELYNSSTSPVDLTGWIIKDNHTQFTFERNALGNTNYIIQPGGYKIITYSGYYLHGVRKRDGLYITQGAPNGTRESFIKFFPEIAKLPNFKSDDVILQNRMILYNTSEYIRLVAPNGKLIDEVKYENNNETNQIKVYGVNTPQANTIAGKFLNNDDGGRFFAPMAGIPRLKDPNDPGSGYQTDPSTGERIHDVNNNLKKSIYRSTVDGYYANQPVVFAVETASPFSSPNINVPLKTLDPFMTLIESHYPNDDNQTEVIAYDIKDGSEIAHSKTYFDDFGKPKVSISQDFKNKTHWASETVYDDYGRKWKESFPIPTCAGFDNTKYLSDPARKAEYLDAFYGNNNTIEPYQATAEQPYSEINYDNSLNPGSVINVVRGNKIVDNSGTAQWKTGYSYTVPAAQEMYYVYGYNYYDGAITAGKEEVFTKFFKSVSVDANGVENVAFRDGEGKTLAIARSGGTTNYPVYSLIGTQGFVDIHIPSGAPSGTLLGNSTDYKVFNLKTGQQITPTPASLVAGEGYRVEAIITPTADPKVYIGQTPAGGAITYDTGALGVAYSVNYYDYAVNVYNKTGQLLKSIQPNGYEHNSVIKDTPAHMQSTATAFISKFTYNSLGQLIETSSPDEGTSRIAYRNDGQIRYSQSAIQADTKVSYTNYDELARPIESGVITGPTGIWATASSNTDGANPSGTGYTFSEQTVTIYDYPDNNTSSVVIPANLQLASVLTTAGLTPANYIQENLAGNVAITFTKTGTTINAMTWYNYDAYGRVVWIVQYTEGLGAKTIHYEYDYKGNVIKVLFQKDNTAEQFVHRYTYDTTNTLTKVETATDNVNFITHAEYSYYITGELKRLNIGQGVQGLDYVYTLGGQLKSINHPSLEQAKDPGGDANDVFGLILDYHDGDYKRTGTNITSSPTIAGTNQDFNGNIKAARWSNKNDLPSGLQNAYTYNYNRNGWMTSATFGTTNNTGAITPQTKFGEGNLTYDANGNIQSLRRTNDTGTVIDQLTYNYNGNNQLNNVNDAIGAGTATYDIDSQNTGNYQYNAIGQMIANVSEGLTYFYNTQGLTTEVKKGIYTAVKFFYNERGQRVKKEGYNFSNGTLQYTEYYALDISGNTMAIYRQDTGSATQTELPIYGAGRLGIFVKSTNGNYMNYQITDHLGNVRAIAKKTILNPTLITYLYSDYYPFGEKLPTRDNITGQYRYAFQGQEKDPETGMEAFQLRLWDGRIGRWLDPDPKGQYFSPYSGMGNNPVSHIDPDGGYETWIGAFLGWMSGGFKGSISPKNNNPDSKDPYYNYHIDYSNNGLDENGFAFVSRNYGKKDNNFGNESRNSNFSLKDLGMLILNKYQEFNRNTTLNFKADIGIDLLKFKGYHYGVAEFESSLITGGAVTPGNFVLYPKGGSTDPYYKFHEPGHALQYRILGVAYYPIIAIPSAVYTYLNPNDRTKVDQFYTEKSANTFWYLFTGETGGNNPRYFFDK